MEKAIEVVTTALHKVEERFMNRASHECESTEWAAPYYAERSRLLSELEELGA